MNEGSVSVQTRNFSEIHVRSASGLVESVRPMVAGRVPCMHAYALPRSSKSSARARALRSEEVRAERASSEWSLMPMQRFTGGMVLVVGDPGEGGKGGWKFTVGS